MANPVWLVRDRADDETEVIDKRTIELLPVVAPDVTIVDFDQALIRHLGQIGCERVRVHRQAVR